MDWSRDRNRFRLYATTGFLLFLVALAAAAAKTRLRETPLQFAVGDGASYYMYLPSLIIDRDLDFTNQIVEHWGCGRCPPVLDLLTERGYVRNKYPIGLALTLAPAFLVAHALSLAAHALTASPSFAPDGYSILYQILCVAFLQALGTATFVLIDRFATRVCGLGGRATALAILAYWLGSSYIYYFVREPFMAHVGSTFWVTAAIVLAERLARDASRGTLALLLLAVAMAIVCRPTNAFVAPVLAWGVFRALRAGRAREMLAAIAHAVPALLPVVLQMLVWRRMSGSFLHYTYGREGFGWFSPALLETLFSSRHGLFFWSPLLLLAVPGWFRARLDPGLREALLGAAFILWYLNSAWSNWWFGGSFGARAFLEATLVLVLGIAFSLERVAQLSRPRRVLVTVFVAATLVFNWGLLAAYVSNRIPRDDYLIGCYNPQGGCQPMVGMVASAPAGGSSPCPAVRRSSTPA